MGEAEEMEQDGTVRSTIKAERGLTIAHETAQIDGQEVLILRVAGYVDASTAAAFEQQLTAAVNAGHHHLRLDLEQLTHLNSYGVGVLLTTRRQVRQAGGSLVVERASAKVAHVLQSLGISFS